MNIIILNSEKSCGKVATFLLSSDVKQAKAFVTTGKITTDFANSARINCLSEMIDNINKMTANENFVEDKTELKIWTLGIVSDIVNKGTFKKWINNGGKKSDETSISDIELQLWKDFAIVYAKHFNSIEVYNTNIITTHKTKSYSNNSNNSYNNRYANSNNYYSTMNNAIKAAWDKIMPKQEEIKEDNSVNDFEQGFF